jgi:hypothetical protein
VLVSGPVTWEMNSVWLVPCIPLCFHYFYQIKSRHDAIGWALLLSGLFISGFPDESASLENLPLTYNFYIFKPIIGELLCLTGLLRMYHALRLAGPEEPAAGTAL